MTDREMLEQVCSLCGVNYSFPAQLEEKTLIRCKACKELILAHTGEALHGEVKAEDSDSDGKPEWSKKQGLPPVKQVARGTEQAESIDRVAGKWRNESVASELSVSRGCSVLCRVVGVLALFAAVACLVCGGWFYSLQGDSSPVGMITPVKMEGQVNMPPHSVERPIAKGSVTLNGSVNVVDTVTPIIMNQNNSMNELKALVSFGFGGVFALLGMLAFGVARRD